jgi:CRP-like cAMP-binding protein
VLSRIVELIQPLAIRADQLGSMDLFREHRWFELEQFASHLDEMRLPRGARLTVQGRLEQRLWLIVEGEALVSADARPIRVSGHGDAAGLPSMLYGTRSLETTIALAPIRAFAAGPHQFQELVSNPRLRQRLTAMAGDQLRVRNFAKGRGRNR